MPSLFKTPDLEGPAWMRNGSPHIEELIQKNKRAEQARINGRKSKGPVTPEGKAKCSRGALKHGLTATTHSTLDFEDPAEFQAKVDAAIQQFRPATLFARDLVEKLAQTSWRIERFTMLETALLNSQAKEAAGIDTAEDEHPELLALLDGFLDTLTENSNPLELLRRYLVSLENQYNRTMTHILKLETRALSRRPDDLSPPYEKPEYPKLTAETRAATKQSQKPPK